MRITSLEAKIPDFKTLSNHANLLRSDHIMFWYHNNPQYNQTLRAVLLTDTGNALITKIHSLIKMSEFQVLSEDI